MITFFFIVARRGMLGINGMPYLLLLRIIEYSLDILWFISYIFCTLSSFLLNFILFFFVPLFCIYIGVSILCNISIQYRKVFFSSIISHGIRAMKGLG